MLDNLGKKEKFELIITGIGIMFLIFMVIGNVRKIQSKKKSMDKTSKAITTSLSAPISFEALEVEESEIREGWGRDPFFLARGSTGDIGLEGLILNGVVWDKDDPYAIINSDIVKVGDKLGSIKIIEITETSVILEQDGVHHILNLSIF